jgi:hypothetical protein
MDALQLYNVSFCALIRSMIALNSLCPFSISFSRSSNDYWSASASSVTTLIAIIARIMQKTYLIRTGSERRGDSHVSTA